LQDVWAVGDEEDEPSRCVSNVVCVQSLFGYTLSVKGIRATTISAEADQSNTGHAAVKCLITKPSSGVRVVWDMFGACLILFGMVTIPMQVFSLPPNVFFDVMAWLEPVYWNLDLLWSFFLGFYRPDGILELRPKVVATHYLKTWFLYDIAVVAIDWLIVLTEDSGFGSFRISRMGRMIRVLRFFQIPEADEGWEAHEKLGTEDSVEFHFDYGSHDESNPHDTDLESYDCVWVVLSWCLLRSQSIHVGT
jgi:hypothetical protein